MANLHCQNDVEFGKRTTVSAEIDDDFWVEALRQRRSPARTLGFSLFSTISILPDGGKLLCQVFSLWKLLVRKELVDFLER
jgi:hypothetical protein